MATTPEQMKLMNRVKKAIGNTYQKSRMKEAQARGQQLPAGIIGGFARLSDVQLKESNPGKKPFVSITGIVAYPSEYVGARATAIVWITESEYNTMQEAVDELYDNAKLLGIDTTQKKFDGGFEAVFKALQDKVKEHTPYKFNTTGSKRGTRVFIQGTLNEDELAVLKEQEETYASANGAAHAEAEPEEQEEEEQEEEVEGEEIQTEGGSDEFDLAQLGTDAEAGDEDAQETLTALAGDAGISQEDMDAMSWEELATALQADSGDEGGEDEGGDWVPEKGETYGFAINSKVAPKNCEVTAVYPTKRTVNLKRKSDGKTFLGRSWDELKDAIPE